MTALRESVGIHSQLSRLLQPTSVAIVGASEKPGSLGASVLSNLLDAGYAGVIHLINPNRTSVSGRPCLKTILDLPNGVDCAVLAIPKAGVLEAVQACAERRVGAAIIFSAGFAESGEQGKLDQAELARVAQENGMVIEGPNCLGIVNAVEGIPLTFVTTRPTFRSHAAGIAIVSQSGAMAAVLGVSLRAHDLDVSYSISTGNEAVTGVEDYLEFLIEDPNTKVIALLVEQFREPRRFLRLAEQAMLKGKALVLLHPGSTSAARASAATHTGVIAGDYEAMRTKVRAAGVRVAESFEELIDVSHLLVCYSESWEAGVAVLTESGAFKALTLDLCDNLGLALPSLTPETAQALEAVLPEFILPSNPLDVTAHALVDPDLYRRTLPALLNDPGIGALVLTIILTDEATVRLKLPPILDAIERIKLSKPLLFAGLDEGAPMPQEFRGRLRTSGIPFFPTAERAFRALARARPIQSSATTEDPRSSMGKVDLPRGPLSEFDSKVVLRKLGFPLPEGALCHSIEEAVAIAESVGYPVVIKAQSPVLLHKTDVGGVILGLRDAEQLRAAWKALHADLQRARPELTLDGILIERMAESGTEFIVGARNDPQWGAITLVGLGGIFADVLHDVRLLPPNLSTGEIQREMYQLKGGAAILQGFRAASPPDVAAVADIVLRIGQLVQTHPEIQEIDLNPVVAHERGAVILDAVLICSTD